MSEKRVLTAYVETGTEPTPAVTPGTDRVGSHGTAAADRAATRRASAGAAVTAQTGLTRLTFRDDALAPLPGIDETLGVFVVHLARELVPVDDSQIDATVAAGDIAHRTDAAAPVLEQLRRTFRDATPSGANPFDVETTWARTFAQVVVSVSGRHPSMESITSARRAQVARIVDRFACDPRLTPVTLASALRVSRRTLYDLTGSSMGGISEYIRVARLRHAVSMLADPAYDSLTMSQIAVRSGLSSSKHLSRALTVLFDTSPAVVRRERSLPALVRSDGSRAHVT